MAAKKPWLFLRRGDVWTIVYPGPDGKPKQKALRFRGQAEKGKAKAALAEFIRRQDAGVVLAGTGDDGPMTVARWANKWLERCRAKGLSSVDDYASRLKHHVLPHIGDLRIDAVTPDHVEDVMALAKGAPRSRRHVYDAMRAMFNKATKRSHDADGKPTPALIESSPCQIDEDDLPKKVDANPAWRSKAVFTREEIRLLTTSTLVPLPRRVLYAVSFMGGSRFGETSALLWHHYVPDMLPLAQLKFETSWNSKKNIIKGTKGDRPRAMPVIPELKEIIDEWHAHGWAEMMGRPPGPNDILIPTERGSHRNCSTSWKQLNGTPTKKGRSAVPGDLEQLGLRPRRQHDARRTFISLARGAGADTTLLRYCTHGPSREIMDVYSEIPWVDLCREVGKLQIGSPAGRPPALSSDPAKPSNSHRSGGGQGDQLGDQIAIPLAKSNVTALMPRVRIPLGSQRHTLSDKDSEGQPAEHADLAEPDLPASPANGGREGPLATLVTLALRQALEALDRGRLDQARAALERALQEERDAAPGKGGRRG